MIKRDVTVEDLVSIPKGPKELDLMHIPFKMLEKFIKQDARLHYLRDDMEFSILYLKASGYILPDNIKEWITIWSREPFLEFIKTLILEGSRYNDILDRYPQVLSPISINCYPQAIKDLLAPCVDKFNNEIQPVISMYSSYNDTTRNLREQRLLILLREGGEKLINAEYSCYGSIPKTKAEFLQRKDEFKAGNAHLLLEIIRDGEVLTMCCKGQRKVHLFCYGDGLYLFERVCGNKQGSYYFPKEAIPWLERSSPMLNYHLPTYNPSFLIHGITDQQGTIHRLSHEKSTLTQITPSWSIYTKS